MFPTRDQRMFTICFQHYTRNQSLLGSVDSMVARLKLKGIDGRTSPEVELAALFESTWKILSNPDIARIDRLIALS